MIQSVLMQLVEAEQTPPRVYTVHTNKAPTTPLYSQRTVLYIQTVELVLFYIWFITLLLAIHKKKDQQFMLINMIRLISSHVTKIAADERAFKKTVVVRNPPLAGGGVVLLHTHVHADIPYFLD